jgi:hypothetical protein
MYSRFCAAVIVLAMALAVSVSASPVAVGRAEVGKMVANLATTLKIAERVTSSVRDTSFVSRSGDIYRQTPNTTYGKWKFDGQGDIVIGS